MSAVLFSPHNDDETLFAFYQILRHHPKVIICLRSHKEELMGGPTYQVREHETELAMKVAGVEWEQWEYLDTDPDWGEIIRRINETVTDDMIVFGPAWEHGGHEQHNDLATVLETWLERGVLVQYLTYKRGHGRSESANEVVPTADERILKDVALACYQSQKDFPPTAPWFGDDQREFLA